MNITALWDRALLLFEEYLRLLTGWLTTPNFYGQIGLAAGAVLASILINRILLRRVPWLSEKPSEGPLASVAGFVFGLRDLVRPALYVILLGLAAETASKTLGTSWLVQIAQSISVIFLIYSLINRFVTMPLLRGVAIWVGIPLATLAVFGRYDDTVAFLDSFAVSMGNIRVSLLFVLKAAIAGAVLFWLGRYSNRYGQKVIRQQDALDPPTKELFAKLFEIALVAVMFVLLLQVLGLDPTALTVFGGAVGVGLGFGLQQIASNFISGIILLMERSMSEGDYIELSDGRAGVLAKINIRSSVLRTFDGKEILVPNEKFITTEFLNWTREDPRQRYEVEFSVAYDTDLHKVPPIINKAVASHPRVLDDPEPVDTELRGFGDSGVNFGVEFWVSGIDDGKNKFSSDILFLVWDALKEANITIPFPQREVRVLSDEPKLSIKKK